MAAKTPITIPAIAPPEMELPPFLLSEDPVGVAIGAAVKLADASERWATPLVNVVPSWT